MRDEEKGSGMRVESSKWSERALEGEQRPEREQSNLAVLTAHGGSSGQARWNWLTRRLLHFGASRASGLCPPALKVSM